jgi:hypothetical protein
MIDAEGWLQEDALPRFPVALHRRPDGRYRKIPLVAGWQENCGARDWQAGAVPGVPMGPQSGLCGLDIEAEGEAWLLKQILAGRVPETRWHRTKSGGSHLLFRWQPGLSNKVRVWPYADFRTDGGYLCWWPKRGFAFEDRPIAALPGWIAEAVRKRKARHIDGHPSHGTFDVPDDIGVPDDIPEIQEWNQIKNVTRFFRSNIAPLRNAQEGQRNDTLNRSAFMLFGLVIGGQMRREEVEAALISACRKNKSWGEDEEECRRTIQSAWEAAQRKWVRRRN